MPCSCYLTILTRIQQQEELDANVVTNVKLELLKFERNLREPVPQGGDPQEAERKEIELLPVVERSFIGEVVVHSLVHVIQHQHVGPGVL